LLIGTIALAMAAAACGGGITSPPASAGADGASPSGAAAGDPFPLTLTAKDIAYTPSTMSVPSGPSIQLRFENQDAGVPHNVVLKAGPSLATELATTEIIIGPASVVTLIPSLVPGRYQFTCQVHPSMTAVLDVTG
jgi:plastocyanin